jgi:hypothetical protein
MADTNNSKTTIADKIHQAVSSMLDTEVRLNRDLNEARQIAREQKDELDKLYVRLEKEQAARRHLEDIISKVAELVEQK